MGLKQLRQKEMIRNLLYAYDFYSHPTIRQCCCESSDSVVPAACCSYGILIAPDIATLGTVTDRVLSSLVIIWTKDIALGRSLKILPSYT